MEDQRLVRLSFGPSGVEVVPHWDDVVDDVVYSGIHQIIVFYGNDAINSIHIQYDNNGSPFWVGHGGGSTGDKIGKIRLNYPREILTRISVHYDNYIRSLKFESNEKEYETYGTPRGTPLQSYDGNWKIVGFHDRGDSYFYNLGVCLSDFQKNLAPIIFGTWGGQVGDHWQDDEVYSGIHQIIIILHSYDDSIDSIHIQYDKDGTRIWKEHGGPIGGAGNRIEKILLDYPREILTGISGHHETFLWSLTFESNLKKYGPYGNQRRGTSFESLNGDWKIVGFLGRSGPFLDARGRRGQSGSYLYNIGIFRSFFPKSLEPISVGPLGGTGGKRWDDRVYSGIHQIIVFYGNVITAIHIEYDNNGSRFWSEHGGSTGNKIEKIQLDYPREILTSISGRYDTSISGPYTYLSSLTFKSNLKNYPLDCSDVSEGGTEFSFPVSDGKIVGFHGSSARYLNCIGVYLSNLHTATLPPQNLKPISVGPWGGQGGDPWDDGAYSGIQEIIVCYGDAVDSIKIKYDNGIQRKHGRGSGRGSRKKKTRIPLKYPEILTKISGHYDGTHIRSLTFKTNSNRYGPYGSQEGTRSESPHWTRFESPGDHWKIVSFHGRSRSHLNSIGVYLSKN